MIPAGIEVFVGALPIDFRWGHSRLIGIIEERVQRSPRSGTLFLFFGKKRDALKILFFDGTGICLFLKRLDKGVFRLPEAPMDASSVTIEEHELAALLDGIDVVRKSLPKKKLRTSVHPPARGRRQLAEEDLW